MIKSVVALFMTRVPATLFSYPSSHIHIIGFGYLLGIMFRDILAKGMRLHLLFLWNLSLKRWIRVVVKSELVLLRVYWQRKCWFGISFVTLVHVSPENWGENIIAFHKTLLSSFWVTIVISICTFLDTYLTAEQKFSVTDILRRTKGISNCVTEVSQCDLDTRGKAMVSVEAVVFLLR